MFFFIFYFYFFDYMRRLKCICRTVAGVPASAESKAKAVKGRLVHKSKFPKELEVGFG